MGDKEDGSDSLAEEVASREHWPEMNALICVVSDAKKGTSSTSGMQKTVQTSPLLQHRIKHVVPQRMQDISKAIQEKDFESFAKITMRDSNSFHAVCLDTEPPIFYLNDVSKSIIAVIEELNRSAGRTLAAYTFDAGPNAVIYAMEKDMPLILSVINQYFPQENAFANPCNVEYQNVSKPQDFNEKVVPAGGWEKGAVKGLIHTRVGDGPRKLGDEESLLDADGLPKTLA